MATLSYTYTKKYGNLTCKGTVSATYSTNNYEPTRFGITVSNTSVTGISYSGTTGDSDKDRRFKQEFNALLSGSKVNISTIGLVPAGTYYISKTKAIQTVALSLSIDVGLYSNTNVSIPAKTSYTISYNANSGANQPPNQTKWYEEALTISTQAPVKDGYIFRGWATSVANAGQGEIYKTGGQTYTDNAAITLYAVWELDYKLPTISGVSIERCNAQGGDDDEGAYAKVGFNWSVFTSNEAQYYGGNDYPYNSNTIGEGSITIGTVTKTFTASDTIPIIVGNGSFSTDNQYNVEISITDSQIVKSPHTTTIAGILSTSFFPMDFNADGTALGLFMPAPDDKEGVFLGKDLFLPLDTTDPPDTTTTDGQIYQALKDLGWNSDVIV